MNAFLLEAGDSWILIGTLPGAECAEWLPMLKADCGEKPLACGVLLGADSDREAVPGISGAFPEIAWLLTAAEQYRLENILPEGQKRIELRQSRTLTVGNRTLEFTVLQEAFAVRSLYVMDRETGTLFTADAFGADLGTEAPRAGLPELQAKYLAGLKSYRSNIFAPVRPGIEKYALPLLEQTRLLCHAYGPVAEGGLDAIRAVYQPEQRAQNPAPALAVVTAEGGYPEELSAFIAAGAAEAGALRVRRYRLGETDEAEIVRGIQDADGVLFGFSEIRKEAPRPLRHLLASLERADCAGKPAAVFYPMDASEDTVTRLRRSLGDLDFDLNVQDWCFPGRPDAAMEKTAADYGFGIGCRVLRVPNPRKPELVRCLVCGEIFDASLGVCPVCGVGLDQCVPVSEDEILFRRDSENRYLILGGGAAAVSAAQAIRQRDNTGGITLAYTEPHLPLNRPMLSKDFRLVEENPPELYIHPAEWYEKKHITLLPGKTAVHLDPARKEAAFADGETIAYDRLIIATGAECFLPPFKGKERKGVVTIRHLADIQEINEELDRKKHAVVIGGGVIGLEAAGELMRAGCAVTVLEAAPQIVGRQIDADTAEFLKCQLKKMGVACFEGVTIEEIEGNASVTGVRLADGRIFPADLVIVACGNRANLGFAAEAGVAADRAIVVNARMQTNLPDIYACGDCAQFENVNYQLWQEAAAQGGTAGANAAGDAAVYSNPLLGLSLDTCGTSLFVIGDPGKDPAIPYRKVEITDAVSNRRETYWYYGGALRGAVLLNTPAKIGSVTQAVTTGARYEELWKEANR